MRADRWIGYPRATEALERLETLLAWPSKQRMPNLLLIGPTNNGKSMIVEKAALLAGRGQPLPERPKQPRPSHAGTGLAGRRPRRARRADHLAALRTPQARRPRGDAARCRNRPAPGRRWDRHRFRPPRLHTATGAPVRLRRRPALPAPQLLAGGHGRDGGGARPGADRP
ncbi:TniB family NTP-binding protein [Streptomyces sp. NPDC016626]|uniref:TniB family NTP-binding protein n=1 Tax=Streptomyces sp. NPDC016626 TaxID=3364968 RepID=UPI003701E9C1